MAITFPTNPSDGDTYDVGGITYVYNATYGVWNANGSGGGSGLDGTDEILAWVTEPNSTYEIAGDDTATVTFEAEDPDGFDVTYSYTTSPSDQTDVDIEENSDGTYTLSRSSSSTGSGSIAMRVKATDGTFLVSKTSTINYEEVT